MAEQSIVEQRRLFREGFKKRMQNLADIGESAAEKGVGIATGIAKEEVFGIPGMFADLSGLAQYVTNPFTYGTNEGLQKATEDLIGDLGATALAAKAGVELSDEMFDEEGELRPEMIGRMVAPGALYGKAAALLPELSSGVQSLVRGLRSDGFFPAGGPQPATVDGPSFMTQAPDDAGPRSSVLRSEALGAGRSASNDNQKIADEIYDYVVGTESPDAIRQLFEEGSNEVATDFLKFSRNIDEVMDPQSPEVMKILQDRFRDDTRAALAERFGFDPENFSMDTPVTVYRVGDIKKGELQSFSLDPEIGSKNFPLLPGQDRRVKRGEARQDAVEYRVRAGDILAMPQASARGIERLNESEVIIEGGRAKTPVQFEKENTFVSPDNPAVDKPPQSALTMGKGNMAVEIPGMSKTGIYLPVKAALENIDIPAGGITGTKLLEKLRGQPRTGRDLTASGFADFLKDIGNNKIDKEAALSAYDAVRNKMVIRTVMSNDFAYDGAVSPGERISYLGMQRQIGAEATERNYGVMLFGDESAKIGDQPITTVDNHGYFTDNLPTHFGHIRFSIQEILDPKTNQPIKALLVEEIQSDLVRAFAQAEQVQRNVKSVESLKKALKKDRPDLDEDTINLMAENEHDQMVSNAEVALGRIFGDRIPYGPGERLADATLAASKDVKQYDQMLKDYKFAEDADELLDMPQMQVYEDTKYIFFNKASDMEADAVGKKLLLTSGMHKAKSLDEAERLINNISDDVLLNIPLTRQESRLFQNLDQTEILAEKRKNLLRDWEKANQSAVRKVQRADARPTGILSNIFKKGVEDQLTEFRREEMVSQLNFLTRAKAKNKLAHRLSRILKDQLLEARMRPLADGEETHIFYDTPNLRAKSKNIMKPDPEAGETTVRKRIPYKEIQEMLDNNSDLVDADIKDAALLLQNELRNIESADPVFAGVSKYTQRTTDSLVKDLKMDMAIDHLSGMDMRDLQQANIYRNKALKMVEDAKQKAPTLSDLGDKVDKIINDPIFGSLFRERYGIAEGATGKDVVASGTDFLSGKAAMKAGDYIPKPPFETQNDFIQFATRALMHEAGKMDVDAVIMPSVEEMILGRQNHIMGGMSPLDKVKNVEKMKQVLAGEKRLREVKSKLQNLAKETDEALTSEDFEKAGILEDMKTAFGFDSLLGMNANEYLKYLTPDGIKNIAKEKYAGGSSYINSEQNMRGHFQNSGEALDAALSGLVKEGFEIEELERLNAKTQDGSKYVSLGGYAQQGKPELAKYRMIDIRKGNKGADVAKKVPSAYNKGGHVDVRGGIGAMAREVM